MTFDSHSLERLKELGRKLPTKISKPQTLESRNSKKAKTAKLHPVETEKNPQQLFRELIEISPDGNVPSHLIDRLKELELNTKNDHENSELDDINDLEQHITENKNNLYIQFKQLLLEDEIN